MPHRLFSADVFSQFARNRQSLEYVSSRIPHQNTIVRYGERTSTSCLIFCSFFCSCTKSDEGLCKRRLSSKAAPAPTIKSKGIIMWKSQMNTSTRGQCRQSKLTAPIKFRTAPAPTLHLLHHQSLANSDTSIHASASAIIYVVVVGIMDICRPLGQLSSKMAHCLPLADFDVGIQGPCHES